MSIFYFLIEAVPMKNNPESEYLDGAFINCWVKADSTKDAIKKAKAYVKWEKWNSKGLKIAKYLRNNLPLDFDIWYQYQNVENDKLVQISKDIEDVIDSMLNQIPRDINSTF